MFNYVEIKPPEELFREEYIKESINIKKELPYDLDVMFIQNIKNNNIHYYFQPFSLHVALLKLGITSFKVASVEGLIKLNDGYLLTIQSNKKKYSLSNGKLFPSFAGLINRGEEDFVFNTMVKELKEELNIDFKKIKKLRILSPFTIGRFYYFYHILEAEMYFDELKELYKKAKDSWEIESLHIFKEKDLFKLKDVVEDLKIAIEMLKYED